ncbi:pyrroline-5-carboxylate reductase [Branchiibius sp. NY16-3462-2]|uniref:pyrroline-5-carboxylate reductase n=1 Tax=Branchiibius sp. NY16-3462-2 TaxID=1807500 RepID=UPI0007950C98|nr:pyrroline-5-carboxylate reductase [Branchiibius sp. NY16-3462-2]KYH46234.1 pyrroline-5-carboxylate reductase [Branchiibius sp. NY16-3462-2]
MGRLAVIGVGVMGEALLAGARRAGFDDVVVADAAPGRAEQVAQQYDAKAAATDDAVNGADVVLLAVKPQYMSEALEQIAPGLGANAVVVSVAAGVTTATLEEGLGEQAVVVRAMPNTPALIGEGVTAISAGARAGEADLAVAEQLLRGAGEVVTVPESLQDAVTAISGSGPAYLFYLAEAMVDAGVGLGVPRATATQLVAQTLRGAAGLLGQEDAHPTLLRERVTSPGGTTAAAIAALDAGAVRADVAEAMRAAARRSQELSGQ